jgi:protein-disulfide isomerase
MLFEQRCSNNTREILVLAKMREMVIGFACVLAMSVSLAAQNVPASNTPVTAAPATPAPQPEAREEAHPFPPVNPKNFTAQTPSVDVVNSFLKALWGYDTNRVWQVAGIVKTPAPGVAKVVVLIGDKRVPGKSQPLIFFTTPDGKHAIADSVMDFGAKPFAETRKILQDRASGPAKGAKSSDLLIVEFADLQCDRCRETQDKIDSLAQDFPQARIVFEDVPEGDHPYAEQAALDGYCVRKSKGDGAFFSYVRSVYAKQAGLTAQSVDATLKAALSASGADPAAVAACAASAEAKAAVESNQQLQEDIGAGQVPLLSVNGHLLAVSAIAYETLKQIVAYQAGQDGITVHLQPTLSTLK